MPAPHYVTASCPLHKVMYEVSSPSLTYVGYAQAGSAASAPVWLVMRIVTTATGFYTDFSNGVLDFSVAWDARASLPYS